MGTHIKTWHHYMHTGNAHGNYRLAIPKSKPTAKFTDWKTVLRWLIQQRSSPCCRMHEHTTHQFGDGNINTWGAEEWDLDFSFMVSGAGGAQSRRAFLKTASSARRLPGLQLLVAAATPRRTRQWPPRPQARRRRRRARHGASPPPPPVDQLRPTSASTAEVEPH